MFAEVFRVELDHVRSRLGTAMSIPRVAARMLYAADFRTLKLQTILFTLHRDVTVMVVDFRGTLLEDADANHS